MPIGLPPSPFLYPILDAEFSFDVLKDAGEIIRAGAKILQLRAKKETKRRIYEITIALGKLCRENDVRFLINDHVDIALITEADGVHLGQTDFPPDEARKLLGDKLIGLSTHNAEQFQIANNLPVDYVAIGPIFETLTKSDSAPALGISVIAQLTKAKSKPVVTIGGIRRHHVAEILANRVDGIALISEIYHHNTVYENTRRLVEEIRSYEKI
jgi:thiamine-phosphate pyrophosphorylase